MSTRDSSLPEPVNTPSKVPPSFPRYRAVVEESRGGPRNGSPPPSVPSGPDFGTLFRAFKRRWVLALSLGMAVAAAVAVGVWFLLAPSTTAYSQIRIATETPKTVGDNSREDRSYETYKRTQAARIKTHYVLNAALKRPGVKGLKLVSQQPEPIPWLEDEIKVEVQDGSEIVRVSMMGADPVELLALIAGVTGAYLDEIVAVEEKQKIDLVARLEEIHGKSRDKLRASREAFAQRSRESGGSGETQVLNERQKTLVMTFAELKKYHIQLQFDLMKAQGRLAVLKALTKTLDQVTVPDSAIDDDPAAKEHLARVHRLEDAIGRYETAGVSRNDSSLLQLRGQMESIKNKWEKRRAELLAGLKERVRQQAHVEHDAHVAQAEQEVLHYAEQEKSFRAEVERMGAETKEMGNSTTELAMLGAQIQQEEDMTSHLAKQLETQRFELGSKPRITLYQEAAIQRKDIKRQVLATVASPLAAFFGVCLVVGWWEHRARRIYSGDEVVNGLGMRLVGSVPAFSETSRNPFAGDNAELDPSGDHVLESIDAIRTVLLRDASVTATRLVMVTSATTGEGKTTLAGHLASSLARAGRRTLLVDCDLRTPAAHQLFEQTLQPGLSEVLVEEVDLAAAIRPCTAIESLWLLPAGQWDRDVLQALAQDGLQKVFERLREDFDFIVVDSHPVLSATDSLLVGQHVDAVILSLLRDVSQIPPAAAAAQRLTSLGIRVLGAVVNGLSRDDLHGHVRPSAMQAAGR